MTKEFIDPKELDAFTMFAEEQDPSALQELFCCFPDKNASSDDPLDALFSIPVQEYLSREETPDKLVSSSDFLAKGRSLFGLMSREDSLLVAQQLLAGNEDMPELASLNQVEAGDESSAYPTPSNSSDIVSDSNSDAAATVPMTEPEPILSAPNPARQLRTTTYSSKPTRRIKTTATATTKRRFHPPPESAASLAEREVPESDIRDVDVLFGKGGKINKHIGNLHYHNAKKRLQTEYLNPHTCKHKKRELVQQLYDIVVHDWGGRFLRRLEDHQPLPAKSSSGRRSGSWLEAHRDAALEKCRQALATPERSREERAARRRMFIDKRKRRTTKTTNSASL